MRRRWRKEGRKKGGGGIKKMKKGREKEMQERGVNDGEVRKGRNEGEVREEVGNVWGR